MKCMTWKSILARFASSFTYSSLEFSSMSSAMMIKGRRVWVEILRAGIMSWTAEIFFSERRVICFSNSIFWVLPPDIW